MASQISVFGTQANNFKELLSLWREPSKVGEKQNCVFTCTFFTFWPLLCLVPLLTSPNHNKGTKKWRKQQYLKIESLLRASSDAVHFWKLTTITTGLTSIASVRTLVVTGGGQTHRVSVQKYLGWAFSSKQPSGWGALFLIDWGELAFNRGLEVSCLK